MWLLEVCQTDVPRSVFDLSNFEITPIIMAPHKIIHMNLIHIWFPPSFMLIIVRDLFGTNFSIHDKQIAKLYTFYVNPVSTVFIVFIN